MTISPLDIKRIGGVAGGMCCAEGIKPEVAYKGSFNVRISPALHKKAAICALSENISLNNLVETAISSYLQAH